MVIPGVKNRQIDLYEQTRIDEDKFLRDEDEKRDAENAIKDANEIRERDESKERLLETEIENVHDNKNLIPTKPFVKSV